MELTQIHHVSMFTANPAKNFEFYTKTMGMRLVKKTVNQDNTSSYHLFYGDERGNPGTQVTFFDIPHAAQTHRGTGSISTVWLRVPDRKALEYWRDRIEDLTAYRGAIDSHTGRDALEFEDFEGLPLILVSDEGNQGAPAGNPWQKSPVPRPFGICGLGPVTLTVHNAEPTLRTLIDTMGFREFGRYPSRASGQPDILVLETGEGGTGAEVHIEERHDLPPQKLGRGGVHHAAFRIQSDEEYLAWHERLESKGFKTTGLIDRYYFRSIYFHEPNGILFELATDGRGFTVDEDVEELGQRLALPPFLEPQREHIEETLKPLDTHEGNSFYQ